MKRQKWKKIDKYEKEYLQELEDDKNENLKKMYAEGFARQTFLCCIFKELNEIKTELKEEKLKNENLKNIVDELIKENNELKEEKLKNRNEELTIKSDEDDERIKELEEKNKINLLRKRKSPPIVVLLKKIRIKIVLKMKKTKRKKKGMNLKNLPQDLEVFTKLRMSHVLIILKERNPKLLIRK